VCQDEPHESHENAEKSDTVMWSAVGTASHQHGLAVCTVYGDCTVYGISGTFAKWQRCTKPIHTQLAG
jgi:hypothetical protein